MLISYKNIPNPNFQSVSLKFDDWFMKYFREKNTK